MPIYQYQGQQYEMAEEDPAAAKNRILGYLEKQKAPEPEVKPAGFSAKDTAIALGQGVIGSAKSLTDVFGAENTASQALGNVSKTLGEQISPERQAEMQRRAKLQEEASKSGDISKEINTFLAGVTEAPVQALAQGLGSIVPYVGTGVLGAVAKLGAPVITALNTVLGAAQGAGSIKGSLYDNVKQELEKIGMKPEEAAAKASKAQEYLGENFLDIAGGAVLGGVGARFGVENLLQKGAAEKLSSYIVPRVAGAALSEAPLEGLQGGQEQLATNRALQKLGFDVKTFEGVAGAAARDAAIGAITGAAVGVRGPSVDKSLTDAGVTEEEKKALLDESNKKTEGAIPPDAMDLETLLSANAPSTPEEKLAAETIDFQTPTPPKPSGKTAEELAADNARIQANLDAGEYKAPKAAAAAQAKIDRQKAEIDAQTVAPSAAPAVTPSVTPAKESIYEVPKKEAGDYVAAIENQTVKPNASILKKHIKALGIDIPAGAGFNQRAMDAIKNTLGGQNVGATSVVNGADRNGSKVLGQQGTTASTTGTASTETGGVGGTTLPADLSQEGEGTERTPLTPEEKAAAYAKSRAELDLAQIGPPVRNEAFPTINPAESQAALEKNQAQIAQDEADRQAALQQIAGEKIPQTKTDADIREQYEKTRAKLRDQNVVVPEWDKLTADERDKYLGTLPADAVLADYDKAAETLAAYRQQKKGSGLIPAEQRIVNGYEESRANYQRSLVIDLPAWNQLSPEAQNAYTSNVKNNSPIEQDVGFEAVAAQLEQEGKGVRGVSRTGVEALRLKGSEQEAQQKAQEELAKTLADRAQAVGKGKPLSNGLIMLLIAGDVNGVLKQLGGVKAQGLDIGPQKGERGVVKAAAERQSILTKLVSKFLSQALNTIKYDSNVIVADSNNPVIQRLEREGKLAEYDPKTDTFYFTEKGLDEATFLHEVVHAGTVKLIYQYLNNPSSLTENQRKALDHLQKIFDFSKKRLGGKFANAYENLYEFVSYALTDNKFQNALAGMQVRPLANYTIKAQDLWKQFTQVLADLYNLVTAKAKAMELRPEIFDAFAKSMAPMNKEALYEEVSEEEGITTLEGEIATESDYAQRGAETELKEKKQKYKPGKAFLTMQPGYEGNLLLEVSEIFRQILEAPEAGIDLAPLAAKKESESAIEQKMREDAEIIPTENSAYGIAKEQQPKNIKYFKDLLFTKPGWRRIASKVQNERYAIKHWQDLLDLADKTIYEGRDKLNNIYDQITLATGRAKNLYNAKVESIYEKLDQSIYKLSKAAGLDTVKTLDMAHRILEMFHEPERRQVKYLMTAPLSTTANIQFGTSTISAADLRDRIFKALDTKSFTKAQAKKLRDTLNSIVFTTDANGNVAPNTKYVDPLGSSPKQVTKKDGTIAGVPIDINSEVYNVTGLTSAAVSARKANYEALVAGKPEIKEQMDAVIKNIQALHAVTTELNKEANYWSQPVSNRVEFYGFENYVPLKGVSKHAQEDEMLDFDGNMMGREVSDIPPKGGKELQEIAHSFDGRVSVSDNPVLQSMSDAVRAAMRAGRKDLTQAIKNSLKADKEFNPNGQGLMAGKVKMRVTFEQRRDESFLRSLPRDNTVFHYNPDGSIDVLEINDKSLREAIRRTYKNTNPLVDIANGITSRLGQLHTRYNYNFAPLNFVRDALTNAWALGAEMGPKQSAKFIADISVKVATKGALGKAWEIAALYESNNIKKIEALAAKDPIIKEMHEYIQEGGMVEYLQGISLKSNFQRLQKDIGRSGVIRKWEQFNKFIDIWTDMFELTSRSAAYAIAKKNFMKKGLNEKAAITKAAAYTKNLANFEQVGEYGRGLGAVFMFFRPSATGAVRAIESALPAFQDVDKIVKQLPSNYSAEDKATFKKNFLEKQKSARYMLTALMAMGMMAYLMSFMMADDDDLGRNKQMNDDMSQWTRFARFHTPFSNTPIQLPWGFGLGAFAAAGAQLTAVGFGQQSMGKALGNIATQISLDSFIPIPFSRMNVADNPAMWALDSITPSMIRPALEWVVNKNGLGQDIYNDSNRRMGDAFMGGDNIPETYKVLAAKMFDILEVDVSPNTLYFLANSYADGPMRIVDAAVNSMYLATGEKEFKAKTDIPLIGSFIGSEPNVDGREFAAIAKQIEKMEGNINQLKKADPDRLDIYLDKHPLEEEIVEFYNKEVGKHLNKLRAEANDIRADVKLTPKQKTAELKENKEEQNMIKYDMVQQFKEYGLKP